MSPLASWVQKEIGWFSLVGCTPTQLLIERILNMVFFVERS